MTYAMEELQTREYCGWAFIYFPS